MNEYIPSGPSRTDQDNVVVSNTTSSCALDCLSSISDIVWKRELPVLRVLEVFSVTDSLDLFDGFRLSSKSSVSTLLFCEVFLPLFSSGIGAFISPPKAWNTGMHRPKSRESMSFLSMAVRATIER